MSEQTETKEINPKEEAPKKKGFNFNFYGDGWDGKFDKLGELTSLIPQFKQFYYDKKFADPNYSAMRIIQEFNEVVNPMTFYPYPEQYRRWRKKWDDDISIRMGYIAQAEIDKRQLSNAVAIRDANGKELAPLDTDLEKGAQTLAGILLNDAQEQLLSDREMEEIFSSDELIKRKNYVLNVFTHITKSIQGNKVIAIKTNQEKRETAGFLMNILQRATAGKMTEEDLELLKTHDATVADINPTPN